MVSPDPGWKSIPCEGIVDTMLTKLRRRRQKRSNCRAFTLIEVLIAVMLLSFTLAAMVRLWSIARELTERTRYTAEYYFVGRQEAERFRIIGYATIFNQPLATASSPYTYFNPSTGATVWPTQYYDENGNLLTSSTGAFYSVVSKFSLIPLPVVAAPPPLQQLGVQQIDVYAVAAPTVGLFETFQLFSAGGI